MPDKGKFKVDSEGKKESFGSKLKKGFNKVFNKNGGEYASSLPLFLIPRYVLAEKV
jgi:hypothetical protein